MHENVLRYIVQVYRSSLSLWWCYCRAQADAPLWVSVGEDTAAAVFRWSLLRLRMRRVGHWRRSLHSGRIPPAATQRYAERWRRRPHPRKWSQIRQGTYDISVSNFWNLTYSDTGFYAALFFKFLTLKVFSNFKQRVEKISINNVLLFIKKYTCKGPAAWAWALEE